MNHHLVMLTVICFFAVGATEVYSQDSEVLSISVEDAVSIALGENEQIKISELEREIAAAEVRKVTAQGLPQANIEGVLNYNYRLQRFLRSADQFPNPNDPGAPNAQATEETPFALGQAYDGNVAFSIRQLLFDGSYFVGLQAARTYRELSAKDLVKVKIDVAESVTKAYYNALIAEERLTLLESNLSRLDTLLKETDQMYKAGFAEKLDVDRIRVNFNNVKVDLNRSKQLNDLSRKLLKFQMGVPLSRQIGLMDDLEDVEVAESLSESSNFSYTDRIEISQLQTNENLAQLDLKNNRSQYLPKLYANFNYGFNTQAPNGSQLFEGDRWLSFGAIGVTASIPVFDGFLKRNKIQQNRLQIKQLENQRGFLQKNIDLEIEESTINLSSYLETLEVRKQNLDLAQEVYDISKLKYQEGVGSSLEVVEADTSLKEAQTNYLNALYEAKTSEIELKKALGTLFTTN